MLRYIALALALLISLGICAGVGGFVDFAWLWILPVSFAGSLLGLGVLLFLTALIASALVDTSKLQKTDNSFYRKLIYVLADSIIWLLRMRVHTKGLEQTPKDGRFLLVCNHIQDLDPVTLLAFFKKSQLAFISKRENTTMFLVGKLMHRILCQLINRENDREALKTILACVDILNKDMASIAVFPEGYTSMDGLLHPFRSGVFKIAQRAKVPIVVCTVRNTNRVFHNILRLRPTDVHLHLLDVLTPEDVKGMTTVDIGNKVHAMMAEDLGPDLVSQETP